ncbi:MAG: HAMP domain-containing sensor histidine kinase [Patulibacter sp.]|nr:HAMP domain-containing sensor histidine kinase [Patulibacter sp.]
MGLTAFVLIASAVAIYAATARTLDQQARDDQASRAVAAAALLRETGRTVLGARADDPDAPLPLRRAAQGGDLATYIGPVDGQRIAWAATAIDGPGGRRAIYVRRSLAWEAATLAGLRTQLLWFTGVGLVATALLGWFLAGRLSRRLRDAAAIADDIAAGDLEARIAAPGRDEVARLGDAVDGATAGLRSRLERERHFSSHVAHELRTPLTALTVASDLLGEGRPAEIVRSRTRELSHLVEELLELARVESRREPFEAEPIDLVEFGTRVAGSCDVPVAFGRVDAAAATVTTDRRHLERILVNVLTNAARHGAAPIEATVARGAVQIRDRGPGFPPRLLADGPTRFWTGSTSGVGLGLSIALAHAEAIGAELHLANDDGAVVTIALP